MTNKLASHILGIKLGFWFGVASGVFILVLGFRAALLGGDSSGTLGAAAVLFGVTGLLYASSRAALETVDAWS